MTKKTTTETKYEYDENGKVTKKTVIEKTEEHINTYPWTRTYPWWDQRNPYFPTITWTNSEPPEIT